MTIQTDIQSALLIARKEKRSADVATLTTLLSEVSAVGKNNGNRPTTDAEATAIIKKFMNNANMTKNALIERAGDAATIASIDAEMSILERFLPKQLSDAELFAVIDYIIANLSKYGNVPMGVVMATLKSSHGGMYDGGIASKYTKTKLSK